MTSEKTKSVQLPDRQPAIRVAAMPADANAGGSNFGGWIMSYVDIAVNSFEFHQPVFVGDLISCCAVAVRVDRTSITVRVEVYSQRNLENVQLVKVTEAKLTYVALDKNRKPRAVPRMFTNRDFLRLC